MKIFTTILQKKPILLTLIFFTSVTSLLSQQTQTNTWSSGDLPMDYFNVLSTYTPDDACTEVLTLTLPATGFYEVTGIDIAYDIEAVGNAWKSEQRSRIVFTNNDAAENWASGSGYGPGVQTYSRTNASIANGVYQGGTPLTFELQAYRTYSSSGIQCNMMEQKILNNTWSITVHFDTSEPITCPAPDNLSIDNITTTSADLSWNETASATEWEVKYGSPGFDPKSAGTSVSGLLTVSTTVSGLSAGTGYDTYVRAVCGTDDLSSWSGPESFTTAFEPITNDACSGAIEISVGDTETGTTQGANTTHDDCNSGKEVWYTFTGTGSAIEIDLESGFDNVMVLYKGNCGSWSDIQCVDNIFPAGGENFTLNSVDNQTYFLSIGSYEDSYYPGLMGSYTLRLSEGCGVVNNLQAIAYPDANSTTLSWEGPAPDAEYQIQYGEDDAPFNFDADETINEITGNSYTITGLNPGTSYDIRIRTACDGEEYGAWTTWGFTTRQQTIDNDLCSGAITITCENTYADQPLSGATTQNSIVFDHCTSNIPGVWYKYTHSGTSDQDVKLTFSEFDPRTIGLGVRLNVSVVSGGANCSLNELVSCFEINRHYPENAFTAHPGATYYIYVASINLNDYNNVSFDMEVSCGAFASDSQHDVCGDAEILECDDTDDGNTDNATDNLDDPEINIGRGNWHTFTGDGKIVTLTIGANEESYYYEDIDFNGYLASGTCSSLNKIASLNNDGDEEYTFQTTNGTTYYLYVGAAGNDSYETGPYKVSMACEDCNPVTLLYVQDHTDRFARVVWDYKANFSDWTIKLGPAGFDPETEGTTIPNSEVIHQSQFYYLLLDNLAPDTDYELYVRADCDESTRSTWEKTAFSTDAVPTITDLSCTNRFFYDSGGESGDYGSSEDYGIRVSGSDPYVLFTFSDIRDNGVYDCEDFLSVHDGSTFGNNRIKNPTGNPYWCGDDLENELFHGSSGSLTFKFHSNGSFNAAGWKALVACDGDFAKTSTTDQCLSSGGTNVGYGGYKPWYHLYSDQGVLIASVKPSNGSMGRVTAKTYVSSEHRELDENTPYMDRSYEVNLTGNGSGKVRLYFSTAEVNELINRSTSATSISDLKVIKTNQICGDALNDCQPKVTITGTGELANTPYIEIETSGSGAYYILAGESGVVTDLPGKTVYLDDEGSASITVEELALGLQTICGVASVTASPLTFDCDDVGTPVDVTLTVTDLSGNKDEGTVPVTVINNMNPKPKCEDITIYLDKTGNASITASDVDNGSADACGIASMSIDQTQFTCAEIGENTVTLTVTDIHGNSSTCTSTITVVDNTPPRFISTPQTPVLVNDEGDVPDPFSVNYTDNCAADMTYEEVRTPKGCGYQLVRTWTIADDSGNEDRFSQTIVYDGSLQKNIEPVAAHLDGLHSGDTLHVEECIPYDISRDDLNAGKDPNAHFKTNIYRLPLPEHHERGMYAFFRYSYIVTDRCGQSDQFDYYLALYDLSPPVFRSFPQDTVVATPDDLPPVTDEVRSFDICQYVIWDTVVTFAVTDPHSMDTLAYVRRWIAEDQSGNLGYRDQFITIGTTQRHDFGTIALRIGQKEDIDRSYFSENAGTNGIQVHLLRYNDNDELEAVDSMMTDNWNGQLGNAFFTPLSEGYFRVQINLPDGYSVLPRPDSLFTQNGWSDTLQVNPGAVTDLGMITLINQPPDADTILDLSKMESSLIMETVTTKSKPAAILFPNPTNGRFTVQSESVQPLHFYIRGITGKLVKKGVLEGRSEIDLSSRPQGIYTIQLVGDDQVIDTKKVVLVK